MSAETAFAIDARGLDHRELNARVRAALAAGAAALTLEHVCGQRYLGAGLRQEAELVIEGVPGNDLACFMDGPRVVVRGNVQDAVANTMSSGTVVVHGSAGDVLAYSMRGGRLFVHGDAGYRVGIHMKEYAGRVPLVVIGGTVADYLAEYMAGGTLVVLGLGRTNGRLLAGDFLGTGMHGGQILLRGPVERWQLGKEVGVVALDDAAWTELARHLADFAREFDLDPQQFAREQFTRLAPVSHRPYGKVYVY